LSKREAGAAKGYVAKARARDSIRVSNRRVGRGADGLRTVERMLVPGATVYARICGATLARAHARWGARIAIGSYPGKGETFDAAVADFCAKYADQTEKGHDAVATAVKSGRITAQTGL
jgi:Uncharacterized protein conserved in bacteria (DUF2252)